MNLYAIVLFVLSVAFCNVHTEATVCAPYSSFKIDCDDCQCSGTGREYSCTPGNCGSAVYLNKNNNNVNDNSIPAGQIYPREAEEDVVPPYPYLNDEIPSSREDKRDAADYLVVDDGNGDSRNKEYGRDVEEVDNGPNNDVAYLVPQDYRRRRGLSFYD